MFLAGSGYCICMRNKLTVTVILIASLVFASMSVGAISAEAKGGPANNCGPKEASSVFSGKIKTSRNPKPTSVTVEAPDGYEITRYCAKAGSAEDIVLDHPAPSVEITHSSGNKLSHYSYWYQLVDEVEEGEEGEEGEEVDEGDEVDEATTTTSTTSTTVPTYLIPPLVWERTPTPTPPAPVAPPAKISVTG